MRVFGIVGGALGVVSAAYFGVNTLLSRFNTDPPSGIKTSVSELRNRQLSRARQIPRKSTHQIQADRIEISAAPSGEEPPVEHPESTDAPDRAAEFASALDAEYAADSQPTREAYDREKAIESLFSEGKLGDRGKLDDIECRAKICRGTISISSEEADREVFEKTFLSQEFVRLIPDAVSVASREVLPDGSVIATFFIHPQSVFEVMLD